MRTVRAGGGDGVPPVGRGDLNKFDGPVGRHACGLWGGPTISGGDRP